MLAQQWHPKRFARTTLGEARLAWRRLSWRQRAEPSFLVIGAQRAGTTAFYAHLTEHPCVLSALRKEVHFFDDAFDRGLAWYRAHFPLLRELRATGAAARTGEGSPYYLYHPAVPERVARTLPDVKLIALLRNPVDRAYSHYHHESRNGREPLSFEEAVDRETERLGDEGEKLRDGRIRFSRNHRSFSYLARGAYVDQLLAWERHFPRDRFLVLNSEEFYANPGAALAQAFEFLGLPADRSRSYGRPSYPGYAAIDPGLRKRLTDHFEPHNRRLFQHLGRSFDW